MAFEEFRATRKPATPETLEAFRVEGIDLPEEAKVFQYGEDADGWCLHEFDGGFWPHAWWYRPNRHETLESAEKDLFAWRAEFR